MDGAVASGGEGRDDEYCIPVETKLGVLPKSRTVFWLETFDYDGSTLFLSGTLAAPNDGDLQFSLSFEGVLVLQALSLDNWLASDWAKNHHSCFDEVRESRWMRSVCGAKETGEYRHFSLVTYDEVFDVICREFTLRLRREIL